MKVNESVVGQGIRMELLCKMSTDSLLKTKEINNFIKKANLKKIKEMTPKKIAVCPITFR